MTSSLKIFSILYYIKQIDSKLLCVCSVIDHRGCQNVVRTSVTHLAAPHVPLFLFLPHFDVICDLLLNRHMATWNLFIKYTQTKHESVLYWQTDCDLRHWQTKLQIHKPCHLSQINTSSNPSLYTVII